MTDTTLTFSRAMAPVDYLLFRGEQDPRMRSAMLSVGLLDVVPDFARLQAAFDRASRTVVRLRQHVVVPALPIGSPQWIIDPDFDLSFHLRHVRLPGPGTIRQLLDFAQPILAAPFDTARPLWEALDQAVAHRGARLQLDDMPLAIVEAHRLDVGVAVERPAQTDCGILPAGEQHQRARILITRQRRHLIHSQEARSPARHA